MAKMLINFVLNFIILCQIKRIECLFVSVGDYSNESIPGLNSPECGLSVKPIVFDLSFDSKCFHNKYNNKTVVYIEKPDNIFKPQISHRVFNGVDVRDVSESPWVVWIGSRKWWFLKVSSCTGVLITPHWVLTAAHCFDNIKDSWKSGLVINIGSNKKEGIKSTKVESNSFHTNPEYPNNEKSDIALIKISGFFPSTNPDNKYFINTICLPERDQVNTNKETAFFYGYGNINDKGERAEYLQKGQVTLDTYKSCTPEFCSHFSENSSRPCPGDSGGPLVQFVPGINNRAILLGITRSIGPSGTTCSTSKWANWVPVPKHIDWILKTMRENS